MQQLALGVFSVPVLWPGWQRWHVGSTMEMTDQSCLVLMWTRVCGII